MSARQPPEDAAPSLPTPSGFSVLARARLKVESVGRSIKSVLICVAPGPSASWRGHHFEREKVDRRRG